MANFDEKKIELFVIFQEKLALKMHDSDFRRDVLEPLILSGATEESLENIVDIIMEDDELKEISSELKDTALRGELKILLKKLIERFSKFNKEDDNEMYIG